MRKRRFVYPVMIAVERFDVVAIPEAQLRQFLQGASPDIATHAGIRVALGGALHLTFVALLLTSLGTVLLALLLPRRS